MNDDEIESVLRRYRPVGPPADLEARLVPARRTWPWAAAAAAILALTLAARIGVDALAARFPVTDPRSQAAAELTELLGGDTMARQAVELMLAEQQMLREQARDQ
jgi:hypothetical protein